MLESLADGGEVIPSELTCFFTGEVIDTGTGGIPLVYVYMCVFVFVCV